MASQKTTDDLLKTLRKVGLAYPEASTQAPWPGHLNLVVRKKTFAFLSIEGEPFSIGCKLPHSKEAALMLPFVEATGYGLGKSGWVTARLEKGALPPVALFLRWIEESYRAVAPKKLIAVLDAGPLPAAPTRRGSKRPPR